MDNNKKLAFGKKNYRLMLLGIVVLILGFTLMTMDKEQYGFGLLGLTVGPVVVMAGFIIQFFAIFAKSKETK
ncbi:DUF3098 domain-containing protein [Fulvivirgaceae bacterium BMA12]|uniref:DUF3098 domain-containing protein n=1 Tax=Agaribacillus aureus TaxID=3051825 RepID=A0ABT8L8Z5_9BACT|nr:DUF3098 domain-containing protein [Fulvivirgaceae bacterium BMA12]